MLAEFVKSLVDLTRKATTSELIDDLGHRFDGDRLIVNGELVHLPPTIPPRMHDAHSIDALAAMAARGANPSVYHSAEIITAILDDGPESRRLDFVRWELTESDKWRAVASQAAVKRSHPEFVQFIEDALRDEIDAAAPGLLGELRSLRFRYSDNETGNVQHGRESIDRDIEAELTGADKLPQTFKLSVGRWAELPIRVTIEVRLVVDCKERKLALKPLADEVNLAEIDAHSKLSKLLRDALNAAGADAAPVFHGCH